MGKIVKKLLICVCIAAVLVSITACRELTEQEIRARNAERWERLPEAMRSEHIRKASFAHAFLFERDSGWSAIRGIQYSGHRIVEFVLSEEAARVGNEGTFYFWPAPLSDISLRNLNEILEEEFEGWDTASFSRPITMEELIEHWEEIYDLGKRMDLFFPVNRVLPSLWRMSPVEESETEDLAEPGNPIADEESER